MKGSRGISSYSPDSGRSDSGGPRFQVLFAIALFAMVLLVGGSLVASMFGIGVMSTKAPLSVSEASVSTSVSLSVSPSDPTPAPPQIGQEAPDFTLTDLDGVEHTLSEYIAQGQTVVLEWFNPMCPFVKKHYAVKEHDAGGASARHQTMLALQSEMKDQPLVWLRINSGKASHPSASAKANAASAKEWGITTPILLDSTGQTGHRYGVKRSPEMYIIDSSGILVYHGAIDNRRDAQAPGDVNYVREALNAVFAGKPVGTSTTKPYGCTIKY